VVPTTKTVWVYLALLILAIASFYFVTIREGHSWGDDFAMYVMQAHNIADATPFSSTGFIYNPRNPLGPVAYPPVFPILLAPVYKVFGLNFVFMKATVIAFFVGALVMLCLLFKDELSAPQLFSLVAVLGFNPFFWDFKDNVLSDFPFLFFLGLALLLHKRIASNGADWFIWGLLLGFAIYCAYGTRSLGGLLLPAFTVADVLRSRRISPPTLTAAAIFIFLATLQQLLVPDVSSYVGDLRPTPALVISNLERYPQALGAIWLNGHSRLLASGLLALASMIAVLGVARLNVQLIALELFVFGYAMVITVWPYSQGTRFLIPVIPAYILYIMRGLQTVSKRWPRLSPPLAAILAGAILITYVGEYSVLKWRQITPGVGTLGSQAAFKFIRTDTPSNAVLVAEKPRAVALFTGRRATVYDEGAQDDDLMRYLDEIHASYALIGPTPRGYWPDFIRRHPDRFIRVFSNSDLSIYRITPNPNLVNGAAPRTVRKHRSEGLQPSVVAGVLAIVSSILEPSAGDR
jgi:4-amino-4-deoxy-L-arabinose transferase-like glycosyltransferase